MAKKRPEKRGAPRVPVRIRIEYETADRFFQDYIRNLSLGGIFIETSNPLPVKTRLNVQFSLPGLKKPISADGMVVHTQSLGKQNPAVVGMGIRFAELDERSRQALDAYIRKQASG